MRNPADFLPARGAIALTVTAAGLVLLLNFKTPEAAAPVALAANTTTGGTSKGNATGTTTSSSGTTTSAGLKNGTYTGSAVQFGYGTVQVQVTVASGKITNVNMLQYPNNGRSGQIAQYSLPTLISETLQAQSSQVSSVSGATYTSQGYMNSLQSALSQANA